MASETLVKEIEKAADEATESMVIDTETLGSSKGDQDVAGEVAKASQSGKKSDGKKSDQEDAVKDPATSGEQKVWKKPESSEDKQIDTDEQQDEEKEEEFDNATQGDSGKGDVSTEISQATFIEAFDIGMGMEDARSFKSNEELSEFISTVKRNLRTQAVAQVQAEAEKKVVKQVKDEDPFKDLELDSEKYDDDVVELFSKMKGVLKKQQEQFDELRQQQVRTVSSNEEAVKREVTQWFDSQIASLGDEFADSLGEGDISTLTSGSSQLVKREEIANQMAIQMAGCQATGSLLPPREKVFADAAQVVLGSEFRKSQERKLQKKLVDRKGKHISRAGGRGEKTKLSPEDEVARMLDEKYKTGR